MRASRWLTFRAVVLSGIQKYGGWVWHLPGRLWLRLRPPKFMPQDEFVARTEAAIARIRAREVAQLAAKQAVADQMATDLPKWQRDGTARPEAKVVNLADRKAVK